jgi:hypothetical protein
LHTVRRRESFLEPLLGFADAFRPDCSGFAASSAAGDGQVQTSAFFRIDADACATARTGGYSVLVRIMHIHQRLGNQRTVTAESLARELEVHLRTIKRDIEAMRDRLGMAIAWDAAGRSYYCDHFHPLLPLLRIDADEALAVALAGRTFAAWRGSPLGQALTSALEKIAPAIGGAVSLPADALKDLLFAPDDPAADAEHRHFPPLLEAIRRGRELRLVYQKPKPDAPAASPRSSARPRCASVCTPRPPASSPATPRRRALTPPRLFAQVISPVDPLGLIEWGHEHVRTSCLLRPHPPSTSGGVRLGSCYRHAGITGR